MSVVVMVTVRGSLQEMYVCQGNVPEVMETRLRYAIRWVSYNDINVG